MADKGNVKAALSFAFGSYLSTILASVIPEERNKHNAAALITSNRRKLCFGFGRKDLGIVWYITSLVITYSRLVKILTNF